MPIFVSGIFSTFSGQFIYDTFLYQLFNTCYTALPVIFYSVLDCEYSQRFYLKNPKLYQFSRKEIFFNYKLFWFWTFMGFYHSTIIFVFSIFAM